MSDQIYDIPLDEMTISEMNVRDTARDKGIESLAESIAALGLLQPVVLIGDYGSPMYELLIGQRRYRAHVLLKEQGRLPDGKIRAVFAEPGDDFEALALSLAENLHRVEINYADAAKAVTELYRHYDGDTEKVMQGTGLSKHMITKYLNIEERASPRMKELLRDGVVKPDDIKRALRAAGENVEKAQNLLDLMVEQKFTTHEKVRLAEQGEENPDASPDELIEMAQRPMVRRSVTVSLGARVRTALQKAVEMLLATPEELATIALEEWLDDKGFINHE